MEAEHYEKQQHDCADPDDELACFLIIHWYIRLMVGGKNEEAGDFTSSSAQPR